MPGSLSFTISQNFFKFMYTESVMLSNHFILCHPLLLLSSIFPSIRVFSNKSGLCIRLAKYWSFSLSLSNEYSGLISYIIDWLDLLAFKRLSGFFYNTTIQKHQFFSAQPSLWSNSHIHTWLLEKNIALTAWTFVGKVLSLLFNMSRFVIAFLQRRQYIFISWLQSPSAVILEPKKIKSGMHTLFPLLLAMKKWDWMPWS